MFIDIRDAVPLQQIYGTFLSVLYYLVYIWFYNIEESYFTLYNKQKRVWFWDLYQSIVRAFNRSYFNSTNIVWIKVTKLYIKTDKLIAKIVRCSMSPGMCHLGCHLACVNLNATWHVSPGMCHLACVTLDVICHLGCHFESHHECDVGGASFNF